MILNGWWLGVPPWLRKPPYIYIDDLPFDIVISHIAKYWLTIFFCWCSAKVLVWCFFFVCHPETRSAMAVPSKRLAFFQGVKTKWRWTSFAATLQWAPVREDSLDAIQSRTTIVSGFFWRYVVDASVKLIILTVFIYTYIYIYIHIYIYIST